MLLQEHIHSLSNSDGSKHLQLKRLVNLGFNPPAKTLEQRQRHASASDIGSHPLRLLQTNKTVLSGCSLQQ